MRAISLLLLALASHILCAQEKLLPVFHFSRLTTPNELPSDEIRSPVVRDHLGYVWIGTVNGLAGWDGYGCKVYKNDPANPHSISSNTVIGLMEDSKKRLWVGTWETGLSLYDAERDRFVNFRPRPGDSTWLQARTIYALLEDQTGNLWLGALGGGGLTHFRLPPSSSAVPPDSLPNNTIGISAEGGGLGALGEALGDRGKT